uniref:glutamate [NMDA] receptor subunit 1-like isoform X1 n=1 Tax=Styela clava TaxID=7725 RepID=UPI00193A9581|nr:glutamate [NMDA] receptor subunit 1-like isoform X1 [Styela clava]
MLGMNIHWLVRPGMTCLKLFCCLFPFILTLVSAVSDKSDNVTIIVLHDFRDINFRKLLDATESLVNVKFSTKLNLHCEDIFLDNHNDVTGRHLFNVGEWLRKNRKVEAVVGPTDSDGVLLFHPHAVLLRAPHFAPVATDPIFESTDRFPFLIRMQHDYRHQIFALLGVVKKLNWRTTAIISSDGDHERRAAERFSETAEKSGMNVLRQICGEQTSRTQIIDCLGVVKRSGQRVISLICGQKFASQMLDVAGELKMTGSGWAWILWSDIIDDIPMQDDIPQHEETSVRWKTNTPTYLLDIPGLLAIKTSYSRGLLLDDFISEYLKHNSTKGIEFPTIKRLKYVDSILAAVNGIISMENTPDDDRFSLLHHVTSANINSSGVTDNIILDPQNRISRHSVRFDVMNCKDNGKWLKIGEWTDNNGALESLSRNFTLNMDLDELLLPGGEREISSYLAQLQFQVFEVVTIDSPPFVYINKTKVSRTFEAGDSYVQYSGFCIDLFDALSKELGFQYNIRNLGKTGEFGSRNPVSGHWNGLIGELVSSKADIAVAPLTITENRATVVDLTSAFMETKLKFAINRDAIMHGADSFVYGRFSFLHPFSTELWVALMISVILMGIYLTVISRLSPYGAHGHYFQSERGAESSVRMARRRSSAFLPSSTNFGRSSLGISVDKRKNYGAQNLNHGRKSAEIHGQVESDSDEEEEEQVRQDARRFMSINNALYFACAGLLWQSPECVPRALSARMAAGIWYMVGVIIVASYTANMVAFVSQTSTTSRLSTVEDLLNQRMILPATVASSSVDSLLMTSNLDVAERLHKDILRNPKISLQPNVASALNLTNRGDVAFIWEGVSLDYFASKDDCHLTTIPLGFGKASYAFALKRGSAFTEAFNRQILKFRQTGFLEELYDKHFKETCMGSSTERDTSEAYDRLTYSSLSGVFLMISVGAAISVLMIAIEWIVSSFSEIDRTDLKKPSDLSSALKIKLQRLKVDFNSNWLPFRNIREHWSKFRPTKETDIPTKIGFPSEQWKRFSSSVGSEKLHPGESISDPEL